MFSSVTKNGKFLHFLLIKIEDLLTTTETDRLRCSGVSRKSEWEGTKMPKVHWE